MEARLTKVVVYRHGRTQVKPVHHGERRAVGEAIRFVAGSDESLPRLVAVTMLDINLGSDIPAVQNATDLTGFSVTYSINEAKSVVARPWEVKFLGFRTTRFMGSTRTVIHDKSRKRFCKEVRRITARSRGRSVRQVIAELNEYVRGWKAYYQVGISRTRAAEINAWVLRRLRAYTWEQWKLPRTKVRNLKKLGVVHSWAMTIGNTRKGPWRISRHSHIKHAMPEHLFTQKLGLVLLG